MCGSCCILHLAVIFYMLNISYPSSKLCFNLTTILWGGIQWEKTDSLKGSNPMLLQHLRSGVPFHAKLSATLEKYSTRGRGFPLSEWHLWIFVFQFRKLRVLSWLVLYQPRWLILHWIQHKDWEREITCREGNMFKQTNCHPPNMSGYVLM